MKLGRFSVDGNPRIGIFTEDAVRDVSSGFDSFRDALSRPEDVEAVDGETFDVDEITHLPPTTSHNSIFCAALNYESHAVEADRAIPERPLIFLKTPRTLVGHREHVSSDSQVTEELDYEGELAAVIGTPARHVPVDDALDHVAGYTICNDVTARDIQSIKVGDDELVDWFSAKAMHQTTPIGPYVVVDEIDDPQELDVVSRVNGETLQDDNTNMMIRSVAELVSYVSSRVRLDPGDVVATGTPEGVGAFQDIRLQHGDTVEVGVEGVGTLVNTVEEIDP